MAAETGSNRSATPTTRRCPASWYAQQRRPGSARAWDIAVDSPAAGATSIRHRSSAWRGSRKSDRIAQPSPSHLPWRFTSEVARKTGDRTDCRPTDRQALGHLRSDRIRPVLPIFRRSVRPPPPLVSRASQAAPGITCIDCRAGSSKAQHAALPASPGLGRPISRWARGAGVPAMVAAARSCRHAASPPPQPPADTRIRA